MSAGLPPFGFDMLILVDGVSFVGFIIAENFCTAKLILYTQGVQMRQDIIVLST